MFNRTLTVPTLLFTVVFAGLATGCMEEPRNFGAFPTADDEGVIAAVTKEEATAVAEMAFEAVNDGSYEKWTNSWAQSMLDVVDRGSWSDIRSGYLDFYGRFISLKETRITRADDPSYVRFSFLGEFEKAHVMMIHVYPVDGNRVVAVHIRNAETGQYP